MIFEMTDCGGCKTCELACGYHHTGLFNPTKSSMRIVDRNDSKPGFLIEINVSEDDIWGCDTCEGLEQPLCVQYCHQEEDLMAIIEAVKDEKIPMKKKKSAK